MEPWRDLIEAQMKRGVGPTAIHELLVEEQPGYTGSLSAVKRLYKRIKAQRGPRAEDVAIPVVTAPGKEAQVDFGFVGWLHDPETRRKRKCWVFVMVLSHSRHFYARVVLQQDIETWLSLHKAAFTFFGGVPETVRPDNLKAAVVQAAFSAEEMGELNRSYRELARHYRLVIDPTPAYAPEKKGKVESAVKYVKNAFFKPREFADIHDANRRLEQWNRETASQRTHGTTGRVPVTVFDTEERQTLKALPTKPFVPVVWHKATVGRNTHVTFERRFYSVPWTHIGKTAWVKASGDSVVIYVEDERVATHPRTGDSPWSTQPGHLPEGRRDFAERDPEHWYARARAVHADVEDYVREVMASDEVHSPLRRVQSIVRQLEVVPVERARAACARAARFGNYRPDGIRRILAQHLDQQPASHGYIDTRWATSPRFARQATEFLNALEARHGCD